MHVVAVFLGRAGVGLLLAALGYGIVREPYQNTVAKLAGTLLASLEPGVGLALMERRALVGGAPASVSVSIERTSMDVMLVGAVLLFALLLGTPGMWRSLRALASIAALLPLQVIVLALASQGSYWELSGQKTLASAALGLLGAYGGLIMPLPLWLWAGGGVWLFPSMPAKASAKHELRRGPAPRNGPCPCGCGRKAKHCLSRAAEVR